jgi:multimeric flavodoxin WrbA
LKILGLIGSPRKGGNTDILVEKVLEKAGHGQHICEKFYLYHYEILPCMDCRHCKAGKHQCLIQDGMALLYPKIDQADVIVFGTPLYWFGPSAKMKLFIDRLRPYAASKTLQGKKGLVVVPAGDGPEPCQALLEMFRLTFNYLGIDFQGDLLATAYEKGEVKNRPEDMAKAEELGAHIAAL